MISNYHTHTWRCRHASGTEREYVEHAIEGGLKVLGFSDHTPYPFPDGIDVGTKMRMDQMDDYVDTVLALKEEYQRDIEIHLGLEVEYLPPYFEKLVKFTDEYPIEYFILGQHYLEVADEIPYVGYPSNPEQETKNLVQYVDLCIEAFRTGRFLYLAHPDLPFYTGDPNVYETQMRRLCRAMNQYSIPGEINFLGIYGQRHYPTPDFWRIAGEEQIHTVFGCDAHQPDKVWCPDAEKTALEYVRKFRLPLIEQLEL